MYAHKKYVHMLYVKHDMNDIMFLHVVYVFKTNWRKNGEFMETL